LKIANLKPDEQSPDKIDARTVTPPPAIYNFHFAIFILQF